VPNGHLAPELLVDNRLNPLGRDSVASVVLSKSSKVNSRVFPERLIGTATAAPSSRASATSTGGGGPWTGIAALLALADLLAMLSRQPAA